MSRRMLEAMGYGASLSDVRRYIADTMKFCPPGDDRLAYLNSKVGPLSPEKAYQYRVLDLMINGVTVETDRQG